MKFIKILERLGFSQIRKIEKQLDELFKNIDVDVDFSYHFKKRIIERNISGVELINTFQKLYEKHRLKIKKDHYKALIYDISNFLNIPIDIEYNKNKDLFILTSKTIFKKPNPANTDKHEEELLKV